MTELDARDRTSLEELVEDLRGIHAGALLAVVLSGEAASAGYRPGRSPLSTVVVLDEVTPEALRRTRPKLKAWSRRRIPTPLFMDPTYIESVLDVFPLEFLELQDHHELLYGGTDPFASLDIHIPHLRLEVEEHLRGKLMHLWEAYLDSGESVKNLRSLLHDTPQGFEIALRGLLRLRQEQAGEELERPDGPASLLSAVEREFGVELPTFRRLEACRAGEEKLSREELEGCFEAYLREIRSLVRTSDAL